MWLLYIPPQNISSTPMLSKEGYHNDFVGSALQRFSARDPSRNTPGRPLKIGSELLLGSHTPKLGVNYFWVATPPN